MEDKPLRYYIGSAIQCVISKSIKVDVEISQETCCDIIATKKIGMFHILASERAISIIHVILGLGRKMFVNMYVWVGLRVMLRGSLK